MNRSKAFGLLACAALMVALAGPTSIHAQAAPQTITITMSEFAFSPTSVTVTAGQPVHIIGNNTGKFPHNIAFTMDEYKVQTFAAPIPGGQSAEGDVTFTEAGTWRMFCPVGNHQDRGMVGQALVLAASAPGMPTTGDGSGRSLQVLALLGLTLLGGGLALRRRWTAGRVRV